jgi:type II secretory pathway component PulC
MCRAVNAWDLSGDVLKEVNGYDLQWPDDYTAAFAALQDATEFTLKINRDNRVVTLSYTVQ